MLEVIEMLQGFEAAAAAWESELLPSRVTDYDPLALDRLCLGGEVVWGRPTRQGANGPSASGRVPLSGPLPLPSPRERCWIGSWTRRSTRTS